MNLTEEQAYNAFMDALNYRIQVNSANLRNDDLPDTLRDEYRRKLDNLLHMRAMMM